MENFSYSKFIFLFIMFSFFSHCVSSSEHGSDVLECILESFTIEFPSKEGKGILLNESHGWTDTSIHLRIIEITPEKLSAGTFFHSEFNGIKLYCSQGTLALNNDGSIAFKSFREREKMIPNNLNWKLIELTNQDDISLPYPEEFNEIQIVYDFKNKCIEKPASSRPRQIKIDQNLTATCLICK